jgi:cell division protein FtsQ
MWTRRTKPTTSAGDDESASADAPEFEHITVRPPQPGDRGDAVPRKEVLDELNQAFGGSAGATDDRPTIAIGHDDELPDAVYLDGGLERDDSGEGTVFIDDDGSSDAIMPKEATAQGIEPRLRQRRIGVRRAENRRRLRWVVIALVVVSVVVAGLAVLGSPWFAVEQVSVSGNVYTDPDALAEVVEEIRDTPVLLVDTTDAEERLEAIAWVEDARVRAHFPDRVTIEIRERTPVAAMLGQDNLSRVLDAKGRVLDVIEGQPVSLVWIAGPGTLDLATAEFAPIGYASAASLVTKLTPNIRSRVDSMLVTPDGADLVLILTSESGPIEVRFGSAIGDNEQIEKLVRLERILGDVVDEPVQVIDVSTDQVTVR